MVDRVIRSAADADHATILDGDVAAAPVAAQHTGRPHPVVDIRLGDAVRERQIRALRPRPALRKRRATSPDVVNAVAVRGGVRPSCAAGSSRHPARGQTRCSNPLTKPRHKGTPSGKERRRSCHERSLLDAHVLVQQPERTGCQAVTGRRFLREGAPHAIGLLLAGCERRKQRNCRDPFGGRQSKRGPSGDRRRASQRGSATAARSDNSNLRR